MTPRSIQVRVDAFTDRLNEECPVCGFDALLRAHGYLLSEHGVTQVFDRIFCARCRAEERREQAHAHS